MFYTGCGITDRMKKKDIPQVNVANAGVLPRSGYGDVLKKIVGEEICPFCEQNLLRHHPKEILFKNPGWIITENAWPYRGSKKHFLLIVRRHIENTEQMTPVLWTQLGSAYKKLCKDYSIKGSSLFMRSGDTRYTGATVRHLHAQIIVGSTRTKDNSPITALVGFGKK